MKAPQVLMPLWRRQDLLQRTCKSGEWSILIIAKKDAKVHKKLMAVQLCSSFLILAKSILLLRFSSESRVETLYAWTNLATHCWKDSKLAKLAITRERSIILQIHKLKSKKTLLEAYRNSYLDFIDPWAAVKCILWLVVDQEYYAWAHMRW